MRSGVSRLEGKYRVLALLGQGGTADVSLAVARGMSGFSKLVVLKSMKEDMRDEPELARMFLNEARLAARLNHPNIVQTNEVFEFEGLPVIVMEYLEGQPLSSILSRSRSAKSFPLTMHVRVLCEALSGLHYSHELTDFDGSSLGVVHRDMSPHNVFVTYDGQVKLLDFGIAKLSAGHEQTATGVVKGKVRYMPPEQITGEGVDRRTDLFAVGVMLWEAATGSRMWHGKPDHEIMNQLLNGEIARPSKATPVAPELERIIMKALAYEQSHRYATAQELLVELEAWLATQGAAADQRATGKLVAGLFADARAETRGIVEQQLSKVASLSAAEYAVEAPVELTTGTHSGYTASQSQSGARARPPARRGVFMGAALLGIVAVALGWVILRPPAAEPAANTSANEPAPAASVQLRVTAFPGSAKLSLDGDPLPTNPASQRAARDPSTRHRLLATAEGFEPEAREVVFARDLELIFDLKPLPKPAASAPSTAAKTAPRPPSKRPASKAGANCSPPFYFDEHGLKKFKPQCLE